MLIPSCITEQASDIPSLSRRVNANSQQVVVDAVNVDKLIKKGEC